MDPFWSNIYDDAKDKRYSGLFMTALLFLFVGLPLLVLGFNAVGDILPNLLGALAGYPDVNRFLLVCVVLTGGLALVAMVLLCRRRNRIGRKAREGRLNYSNLSRDELLKARSKLKNQTKSVKFRAVGRPGKLMALQTPDTDLKY